MRAIEEAAILCERHQRCLANDLTFYLKHGGVICESDRLILWKEAKREDLEAGRIDRICLPGEGDTWYVHLAVGRGMMRWFMAQAPQPKAWLAWYRGFKNPSDNVLKIYPFLQLKGKL